jgi:hypothetical protein
MTCQRQARTGKTYWSAAGWVGMQEILWIGGQVVRIIDWLSDGHGGRPDVDTRHTLLLLCNDTSITRP